MNLTIQTTCPNCFSAVNGQSVCGRCHYEIGSMKKNAAALPVFSVLNQRYIVGRVLGQGGFGITYVAWDMKQSKRCCIKEYMPSEYAMREAHSKEVMPKDQRSRPIYIKGQERFILEAKTLYNLRGTYNIVTYWNYFTENHTAYIVMEFLSGDNLRKYVNSHGGRMDWRMATEMLLSTGSTLMEVHKKNILHRDISPENIFLKLNSQGKFMDCYVFIDFGAAKSMLAAQSGENSVLLKPGYAPPEQYKKDGILGPASDIYSLAATYYNVVAGKLIPDAYVRSRGGEYPPLHQVNPEIPKAISDAIDKALMLDANDRFQDCGSFLLAISAGYKTIPTPAPVPTPPIPPPAPVPTPPIPTPPPSPTGKNPVVIAKDGQKVIGRKEVSPGVSVKIGRHLYDCQIVVEELEKPYTVSRVHCTVYYSAGNQKFVVTDLSANGTFGENGQRLQKERPFIVEPGHFVYLMRKGTKVRLEFNLE